eukprot:TRINITY_DN5928_c0_g1_i1.p1 TRINITY_DN5928_c0_g1~~TRINITY_DN5928_c0_g1_i1.p1  ORF type:complete len:198 (-),score=37.58 TRINITY_DN5928_c0_g1_i1:197-748(-)
MMKSVAVFILFFAFCSASARLLVQKSLDSWEIVATRDTKVNITVYNVGESTAYGLSLDDSEWSTFDVSGSVKAHFEKLPAGANVTHQYTVKPKVSQIFESRAAKVTYRDSASTTDPQKTVYSNQLGKLYIESLGHYEKRTDPHYVDWAIVTILSVIATVPAYLTYTQAETKAKLPIQLNKKDK